MHWLRLDPPDDPDILTDLHVEIHTRPDTRHFKDSTLSDNRLLKIAIDKVKSSIALSLLGILKRLILSEQ